MIIEKTILVNHKKAGDLHMAEENIKKINIKKKKSNRSLYYGVAANTGELLSVHDVERGLACGCICPAPYLSKI